MQDAFKKLNSNQKVKLLKHQDDNGKTALHTSIKYQKEAVLPILHLIENLKYEDRADILSNIDNK